MEAAPARSRAGERAGAASGPLGQAVDFRFQSRQPFRDEQVELLVQPQDLQLRAQVLGPILVGPRARVGANAVVTRDVPASAVMVGIPARPTMVEGGAVEAPSRFVPYGTPCSDLFDPATQKLEIMRCELESMRKRLDAMLDATPDAERDRA